MSMSIENMNGYGGVGEKKTTECSALPKGWMREEIMRKSGLFSGKVDVCYYSPNGKKFISKPQLARFVGDTVDLSAFDFQTGRNNPLLSKKNKKQRTQFDYKRGVRTDSTLMPPIRQTASIFKQPVTVFKTQSKGYVNMDLKHGIQEKPKQVFWEKRLEKLKPSDPNGLGSENIDLPVGVFGVGPNVDKETIMQSLATALHSAAIPITGQTGSKSQLSSNPGVYINPEQPLIQELTVQEEDIEFQEQKVNEARKNLQEALNKYFDF